MGIFSTTSPFDADVDKATDENKTSEDWGLIMELCDKVGNSPANAKDCLRSILRRLNNPDPHVVLQAITLLDACVNNCGKTFQLEIASRDFESELKKLLSKSTGRVSEKLREVVRKWAEGEFKSDPQLSLVPALYHRLKHEGMDFSAPPDPSLKSARPTSVDPDTVSSQQEVDDIAKAIELSLKETQSPKGSGGGGGGSSSLYPSMSGIGGSTGGSGGGAGSTAAAAAAEPRKVRALYDFEAAEDNELTFFAGEIIHVLDDSDVNWWKGCNQRGEGLFPANFVSSDLSVEPEKSKTEKKGVQFNESVQVKTIRAVQQVEIDESKIDRLLHLLHEADPNDGSKDSEEMLVLEEEVTGMGPLIDSELERVDRKHAQLTQLSSGLVEALNLYHTLMREPGLGKMGGGPPTMAYAPPPPPHMYNGGPGPFPLPPMPPLPPPDHQYMLPYPPPHHLPQHPPQSLPPHHDPFNGGGMYMGGGGQPGMPQQLHSLQQGVNEAHQFQFQPPHPPPTL